MIFIDIRIIFGTEFWWEFLKDDLRFVVSLDIDADALIAYRLVLLASLGSF